VWRETGKRASRTSSTSREPTKDDVLFKLAHDFGFLAIINHIQHRSPCLITALLTFAGFDHVRKSALADIIDNSINITDEIDENSEFWNILLTILCLHLSWKHCRMMPAASAGIGRSLVCEVRVALPRSEEGRDQLRG